MPLRLNFSDLIKAISLGLIFLGLSSCSSIEPLKLNDDFYQLQAIPVKLQDKIFLESLTFKLPEKRQLLTQIEINKVELNLAAMTYSGLTIMQAKWHVEKGLLDFSSQVFDKYMLMRIIRDIQLVKWPENIIKSGLLTDYQLLSKRQEDQLTREISNKNKVIVSIIYTQDKVVLTNFIENYELVIENINE